MSITVHEQAPVTSELTIDNAIAQTLREVKEMPAEESDNRFKALVECAESNHLPDYVEDDAALEAFLEAVPAAQVLVKEIKDTAHEMLNSGYTPDATIAEDLGIAADVASDPSILDDAIKTISNTAERDYKLEQLLRSMETARERDMPFTDVYRKIRNAEPVVKLYHEAPKPMSQRLDFTDEYAWLSDLPKDQARRALARRAIDVDNLYRD